MRLTVLLILIFQITVKAKATFGSLAALPNFKKGLNLSASFINIVQKTLMPHHEF
jgi:hypothetical protein